MLTYPHIDHIAISIGPVKVHWYGIMYLIGFMAAWWLARHRARRQGSTWTGLDVDDLIFYCAMGVIIGGRVGWCLVYGRDVIAENWLNALHIWDGGMSFHGGLTGVIVAAMLFARIKHKRVPDVFDFLAPLPGIGLMAGRLGNFINGELWGAPTDGWWGMKVSDVPGGPLIARHPSQLYEAALEGLVLFTILWLYTRKPRLRYMPSALFLLCYSLARITVEFVRLPDAQIGYLAGGWLTMGQVLSLPMLAAGVVLLLVAQQRRQPSGNFGPAT
jgi:phosphatidylglycerol:prolipoprotein diacylglycerol transferase